MSRSWPSEGGKEGTQVTERMLHCGWVALEKPFAITQSTAEIWTSCCLMLFAIGLFEGYVSCLAHNGFDVERGCGCNEPEEGGAQAHA